MPNTSALVEKTHTPEPTGKPASSARTRVTVAYGIVRNGFG